MKTVYAVGLLIPLVCAGQLLLAFRFWRHQLLERSTNWLWSVELKRHCFMRFSAAAAYPCPAEERVLIISVLGVPVWWSRSVVGLPAQTDARIDAVQADEFDAAFERQFRLGHLETRHGQHLWSRVIKG